jgi:Bacterial regulatory proteins, luxR family
VAAHGPTGLAAQGSRWQPSPPPGGNAQITRLLQVSVSTIETHLERIYAKLGIRSRHELIAITAPERYPARRCRRASCHGRRR